MKKIFHRENIHGLLTGATKRLPPNFMEKTLQIATKLWISWKFSPSKVSRHEVMTEAKEHISKNEAQHTRPILIAKSPNCQIKPLPNFPKSYFWTDIFLDSRLQSCCQIWLAKWYNTWLLDLSARRIFARQRTVWSWVSSIQTLAYQSYSSYAWWTLCARQEHNI